MNEYMVVDRDLMLGVFAGVLISLGSLAAMTLPLIVCMAIYG